MVKGSAGFAGELGHVHIPMYGLLGEGQPLPHCNCGFDGDAESVASLTGIEKNLLPYWLTQFPDHELTRAESVAKAAKLVRAYGEQGDPLALKIFEQQAMAIGRLFTIAANFTDPDAYFVGGGVVEAAPASASGSSRSSASTRRCARNKRAWRGSRSCPTSTWPAPAAPRSPRSKRFTRASVRLAARSSALTGATQRGDERRQGVDVSFGRAEVDDAGAEDVAAVDDGVRDERVAALLQARDNRLVERRQIVLDAREPRAESDLVR